MVFPQHLEVYQILESVFRKRGIHHYLIGANAKDIHLTKVGITPLRGTADIDFAIMVPDIGSYTNLFEELFDHGMKPTKENYRLIYDQTNTVIDLLPYGQIEQKYTVNFLDRNTSLSVIGFKEVGDFVEKVNLGQMGHPIPVAPVEGLIILKLVAWNERPDRERDLQDISHFLSIGWDLYEEEAFTQHLDLFDQDDFEMTRAAARIVGRKIGKVLALNQDLSNHILTIIQHALSEKSKPDGLEVGLAQNMRKNLSEINRLLTELYGGILDNGIKPPKAL